MNPDLPRFLFAERLAAASAVSQDRDTRTCFWRWGAESDVDSENAEWVRSLHPHAEPPTKRVGQAAMPVACSIASTFGSCLQTHKALLFLGSKSNKTSIYLDFRIGHY